ncbi:MAG: hypothetical protein IKH46_06375 [Lachnospiraceae bacterium]|jgi:hypothetical protein|nr:hypothetical protein [Lachnospiraceae bacterium]MBR6851018.1 hypothetical protein [Lachnospiraceae bacterium]
MDSNRIEGLWDCSFCGQKEIRARFDRCPACAAARAAETVFYMPTNIQAATLTAEEAAKTSDGADWVCAFCGNLNRCDEDRCRGCGSDRAEANQNYGSLHASTAGTSYEQTLADNAKNTGGNTGSTGGLRGLAALFRRK